MPGETYQATGLVVGNNGQGHIDILPIKFHKAIVTGDQMPIVAANTPLGCELDEVEIYNLSDDTEAADFEDELPDEAFDEVVYGETVEDLLDDPAVQDAVVEMELSPFHFGELGTGFILRSLTSRVCGQCLVRDDCRLPKNGRG